MLPYFNFKRKYFGFNVGHIAAKRRMVYLIYRMQTHKNRGNEVSLVLRNEIPFPEIPCTFKWHAKLPQNPLTKNKQTKKMVCILMKKSPQFLPTYGHVWM